MIPTASAQKVFFSGQALGTEFTLQTEGVSFERAREAFVAALLLIDRLEPQLTTYRHPGWAPGDILKINAAAGGRPILVGEAAMEVLLLGRRIAEMTGGIVDITLGPLSQAWGLESCMQDVPSLLEIQSARRLVDWRQLEINSLKRTAFLTQQAMSLDVAGIAKGYIIEKLAGLLENMDIPRFILRAGGDMTLRTGPSDKPFCIGVRDPRGLLVDDALGALRVQSGAISTAGDYERGFAGTVRRYHHVLDPRSGMPSEVAQAAIVVHESALWADAFDEVLMILGARQGLSWLRGRAEALVIDSEGQVFLSNNLFLMSSTRAKQH